MTEPPENPQPPAERFTLGRSARLRHQLDIKRVFDTRISVSDSRLVVYVAANATEPADKAEVPNPETLPSGGEQGEGFRSRSGAPAPALRVGLAVSRRLGGAVVRNLYKRLLREAFRLSQHDLLALIAKTQAATKTPAEAKTQTEETRTEPLGFDFILLPRFRPAGPASLAEYRQSLLRLAEQALQKLSRRAEP